MQKRCVQILDSIENKIALNDRINHNLEDFLLSLYGRLLDSQCGSSTIGQVSERVYSGGTPDTKNSDYWGGTINWLSSGETSNHFIIDTEKRITENGVLHSSTKFASKYDVVIASAGQGNTRGQTSMTLLDTCINQSVIVIHANTYEAPIVFCSLANRYDELRAISDASSIRGSLTTKMISALEIPVFPEADTFKFASQAKYIIDQIENNLRENHSLKAMRDSLLPRLMSGEFCK
jgi:type I restriction enzyme S subunit